MYRDVVEEKQVGNLTVRVMYDEACPSPREDDNLGTMMLFHRRHALGDKHGLSLEDAKKLCNSHTQITLPVFLYDHGIQILSTQSFVGRAHHAEWDSGMVGWITVSKKQVREEYGWNVIGKVRRDTIQKHLNAEVEIYSSWLCGECYYWEIFNAQNESLDLVAGYIGNDNIAYALAEGVKVAEQINAKEAEKNGNVSAGN